MKKTILALLLALPIFANTGEQDQQPAPQPCLELTQEKLIGLESKPGNELVFISNKCSYADFSKELKEKLQSAIVGDSETRLQLLLKDEKINIIMDTLATDHVGSTRFSYEDTKKIEDFYSSTKADSLKQSGNLESFREEQSDDFYLVLFFNAEKDRLIVIYKRLTEASVKPGPTEPSEPNDGSSDDLPSEEVQ
ncbi:MULTISPECIES: hypothetical protein [unclassified Halobacteriovorax]|uniref:hypothetical protein n=1 Tax=unclassified Halobacteriovorax TaxID=2639665 RepID=UPI00399AE73B